MLKNMKLSGKLTAVALIIGFVPLLVIGIVAMLESSRVISDDNFRQLKSIREIKKTQLEFFFDERRSDIKVLLELITDLQQHAFYDLELIQKHKKTRLERYFQEKLNDLSLLSKSELIVKALEHFKAILDTEDHRQESFTWQVSENQFGVELEQYREKKDYSDLFLITEAGDIVYTLTKGAELGQNVLKGALKETGLYKSFQKGLQGTLTIQDFEAYSPADNRYIAFIAAPIYRFDKLVGVLILSLSPEDINRIVQERASLKSTGETYLVGKLGGKTSYRSDRVIKKSKYNVVGGEKSGQDIDKALAGQTGILVKRGSTGHLELSAYAPLELPGLDWCIITTERLEDALIPKSKGKKDFFAYYVHQYGYHDFLLIHPQGEIFYTVAHEADYRTDILNGEYANSHLGKLVKEVLQTKAVGISDYAPYAPSSGEPNAFIAAPLLNGDKVELIIVMQLGNEVLNAVMQQRAGMGESGESYLVGSDKLMRSNAFLDPENRSMSASFANPSEGSVDTESSRAALVGETGEKITLNYQGHEVLSAYTPLTVGNKTWALIAEVHKAEAFASITDFQKLIAIAACIIGVIVLLLVNRATRRLIEPLSSINNIMRSLAQGQPLEKDIVYRGNDEIAEMVVSIRQLKDSFKTTIAQANAIASGDYTKDINLLSEQDQLGQALFEMTRTLREVTAKNTKQDWLKTGQMQLGEKASGEQDIVTLAKNVITFLTSYLDAEVGLFYLLKKEEVQSPYLYLVASYAYIHNDNTPEQFLIGEGLVGQAALERKTIFRSHKLAESTQIIQSGLSRVTPCHIVVLPLLYEEAIVGVIELGFAEDSTNIKREFLEQIMSSIGIVVNTALSRTKMQTLLQQTQAQAEQLQSQTEELRTQQEQMQQTNEELQTQAEELQSQQEELRQTNDELETRTQDLEQQKDEIRKKNDALEQAQMEMENAKKAIENKAQELELASKYKSEFLANMSHELRTPLNSLLILAQLLAENKTGNLTEKQQEYARTIHSAGADLLTLINDILDLSKVEAGKMEVHPEEVPPADLIRTIEPKFRHIAEEKRLAFHIVIGQDLPQNIYTDTQRLKQIINNMLSNAFKFTSQGEVKLEIRRPLANEAVSSMGFDLAQTIAIGVIDTGLGIPKEKQQLIFEAFQQVDGTTSRRYGGTGLGLSISRQLARLLGGELRLHSEVGQGSTFTLYLPERWQEPQKNIGNSSPVPTQSSSSDHSPRIISNNASAAPTEVIRPPKEEINDDRTHLTTGDKCILIVEDDRKFSNILMELAREKGFKCLIAEDGQTGLQLAETYHPQAIVLDVGLPKIDGWTVMERLKDNPAIRHIPVHFMSAADESLEAKKKGAIGYLLKPVNMEQLGLAFKKIEQFIAKTVRKLLVVVDNTAHQQEILDLVGEDEVQPTVATNRTEAYQLLQTTLFDCLILDLDTENATSIELLEQLRHDDSWSQIPIILYVDRELTPQEEDLVQQCTETLTVKAVQSPERLLDEATLFLHQIEANLPQQKRQMLQMVHDKTAILMNKKVLVVDDDIRNTFALTTILEDKDMEVIAAKNGKEALQLLDKHPDVNIVLMDIMMPEMDGYEATQKIRAQERFRKLPVIALTAKAMKGDKNRCIEVGANDYLAKPIDTDKLVSLMKVWLYR